MSWQLKQRVNFFTDDFRPPKMPEDIRFLLTGLVLTFAALSACALLLLVGRVWQESVLTSEQQERLRLQQLIAEEMQRLPPLVVDPQLEQQLKAAQDHLQNSQRVLAYLSREGQSQRTSFTALVTQLGQAESEGVWLSAFSLLDGGHNIELRGFVKEARQLSPYIEALTAQPAFQGRAFRQVDVSEENQHLQFYLDTRAPALDSPLVMGGVKQ
ncbi:hypothetical protein [Thalassolituus marinus]|uniref:MSHA biogenesis protein MshI n=1 Tax=Thalassolituus marinus TaxID=671053 RepID=A0ABS7ZV13_9GAMM|nr:hypothetical protein [Thalassolituus marinus]MCA6064250.1 hypothetical protein [Thalassolituus marinus]